MLIYATGFQELYDLPVKPVLLTTIVLKTAGVCSSSRDRSAVMHVETLSIENETNSNINRVFVSLLFKLSRVRVKTVELLVNF